MNWITVRSVQARTSNSGTSSKCRHFCSALPSDPTTKEATMTRMHHAFNQAERSVLLSTLHCFQLLFCSVTGDNNRNKLQLEGSCLEDIHGSHCHEGIPYRRSTKALSESPQALTCTGAIGISGCTTYRQLPAPPFLLRTDSHTVAVPLYNKAPGFS